MDQMELFQKLYSLDVNEHTEKKNGLTYLSWAWAWAKFKRACPDAVYEIVKTPEGLPYVESEAGVMCYTRVTACGVTHEMWLPVMDYKNKAIPADVVTMTDINKTIMRCLTKNLAMFGLGLYIYAGEDLPEDAPRASESHAEASEKLTCVQCGEEIRAAQKGSQKLSPAMVAQKTGGKCMKCYRNITIEKG